MKSKEGGAREVKTGDVANVKVANVKRGKRGFGTEIQRSKSLMRARCHPSWGIYIQKENPLLCEEIDWWYFVAQLFLLSFCLTHEVSLLY